MAKKKARRHSKGFTLPLAVVLGFVPIALHARDDLSTGGVASLGDGMIRRLTGFGSIGSGKTWEPKYLWQGLFPILGGIMVHKLAGKLGVNRALSGIPFIRI